VTGQAGRHSVIANAFSRFFNQNPSDIMSIFIIAVSVKFSLQMHKRFPLKKPDAL
jgi:hypothetical protein